MNGKWSRGLTLIASIAILMAVRTSNAADPDDRTSPGDTEAKKFTGTVQQFNFTPRGERDGILLSSDGKLVQLNFPPQEASKLADAVAVGDQITAEGRPEQTKADHTVCRLEKLTTAKGTEIAIEGPPRPRGREGAGPGDRGPRGDRTSVKTETIIGVVKYLNHGPRGEVDGAVLESGEFLHTGPREAEEAKLEVGKEISVEGQSLKMPDGHTMIEHPTKINGKEVSRPPRGRGPGSADRSAPPTDRTAPRGEATGEK